ncbi:MAG: hypothetical protein AAFR38_07325 [Planctomycetota bacterium]
MSRSKRKSLMIKVLLIAPLIVVVDRVFLSETVSEASGAAAESAVAGLAGALTGGSAGAERPELFDALAALREGSEPDMLRALFPAPPEEIQAALDAVPDGTEDVPTTQVEDAAEAQPVRIEGVLDAGAHSAAVVNGTLMRIGDVREGVTLLRVEGRAVWLKVNESEVMIEVARPVDRSSDREGSG